MRGANKSRKKLTQEEAEKKLNDILSGTTCVVSEPFIYNGVRDTNINLYCRQHNYSWSVSWRVLCFDKKREKYCGCRYCKLLYSKDKCLEAASKCKYRSEFQSKYKGEYMAAMRNGWLDEITMHMPSIGNKYNRCIYVYEFPNIDGHKYAYVGLTDHAQNEIWLIAIKEHCIIFV